MNSPLIIALPSKGRLKEQTEAWLADCGFEVSTDSGRGYKAGIGGLPGAQVQFHSAGAIAGALEAGDVHLGVTGEDLLRELGETIERRVMLLRPLGFGRADVVVAAPQSWLDVETMADVEEVAQASPRLHRRSAARGHQICGPDPSFSSPAPGSPTTESSPLRAPPLARCRPERPS